MKRNACPKCGSKLVERHNSKTGSPFWGCSRFPKCKCTEPFYSTVGDEDLYPDRPNEDIYIDDDDDCDLYGDEGNWMDFGDN